MNFNFSLAYLRALSRFFNGRKTVSRIRPLNNINNFGFIFEIRTEILGSDFQRFTEIFVSPFRPKVAGPLQSEVLHPPPVDPVDEFRVLLVHIKIMSGV